MKTTRLNLPLTAGLVLLVLPSAEAKWATAVHHPAHQTHSHPPAPAQSQTKPATPQPASTPAIQPHVIPYIPPQPKVDPKQLEVERKRIDSNTVTWLKQRADEGSTSAQYSMGVRYLNGDGVEKNPELAKSLLQKSADGGDSRAQRKLDELKNPDTK